MKQLGSVKWWQEVSSKRKEVIRQSIMYKIVKQIND